MGGRIDLSCFDGKNRRLIERTGGNLRVGFGGDLWIGTMKIMARLEIDTGNILNQHKNVISKLEKKA